METTNNSFFTPEELIKLPFKKIGKNVLISRKASFYNYEGISIGDHVRIDDFCILSGEIYLGSYIHISAHCALYGSKGIVMNDFSGLSPGCKVFSITDDFSGEYMIGPMLPEEFTNVQGGKVIIEKYVQIGAGSIVFPDLIIHEGATVGAMSLVNTSLEPWKIHAGIPASFIRERNRSIIELAKQIKTKE